MNFMITNISKYIIIIFITIYTYYGFRSFAIEDDKKRKKKYNKMVFIIMFIHLMSYFVLYINLENNKIIVLYLAELVVFLLIFILYQWVYPNLSRLLLNNVMIFIMTGLVILTRLSFDKALKHFIYVTIAFTISIFIPLIIAKLKVVTKLGWLYVIVGILALLSVSIFGYNFRGAQNWISILGFSFQPSEFVKILFVFAVAGLLSYSTKFLHIVKVTFLAAIYVLILVLQRDLGGALIFYVTYLMMLYVASKKVVYLFSGLLAGIAGSYVAYNFFGHVRIRVLAWQDPFLVIDNEGYQVSQSLFAMGTGGWFGMGLTQGMPESIPIVDSDFIFPAISEEMGGIYALCLILIFITTLVFSYNISSKIQGEFYKLLALGLTSVLAFQAFLSIGGATKLIPSTGVTLPFISYGGSSILSCIIMFAIIQGLFILNQDRIEKNEKTKQDKKNR